MSQDTDWRAKLRELGEDPAARREVAIGRTSAAAAQLVGQRMHQLDINQAELARRLGISDAALSRKLNKGVDMRLSSITAILWELGIALFEPLERLAEDTWIVEDESLRSTTLVYFPEGRESLRVEPEPQLVEEPASTEALALAT